MKKPDIAPHISNGAYEIVPTGSLNFHPQNVRQGDVGLIMQSIQANGFVGACLVQRSTRNVIAGNHRLCAAHYLGLADIPVIWVDCSDEAAVRMMLADNGTSDKAVNDSAQLEDLLRELAGTEQGLDGTGYDGDDLERLLEDAARQSLGFVHGSGEAGSGSGSAPDDERDASTDPDRSGVSEHAPRDTGRNPDGSIWAICPDCNREFEVRPGKTDHASTRATGR